MKVKIVVSATVAICLLATVSIPSSNGLNILGIFLFQGKSHSLIFRAYLRELAKRGHNVTVISFYPETKPLKNYRNITLANSNLSSGHLPMESSYWSLLKIIMFLLRTGTENCEVLLTNKEVQNLIENGPTFDVVVMEQFTTDCGLGIAYKLNAPVVTTGTSVLMPWHYQRLGIPYIPSYVPFRFLEGGIKPTLYQRIERVVFDVLFRNLYYFVTQRNDQKIIANYLGDDIPPLEDLARDVKFLLIYTNLLLTGSRIYPANVIEVGGCHVEDAKPLTGILHCDNEVTFPYFFTNIHNMYFDWKALKKFVDEAEHGVIYISYGTMLKSSTLPKEKLKVILAALAELPQRVIWKWEEALDVDKNKFYIDSWLPQVDILGHLKTVTFFSHAGLGGTIESLHYGVPMVAMPIMGDQPSNAAAIEECGLGVQLQYRDLTKMNLMAALKKVLNPAFRENVKKLSKAWRDRPLSPLDTAVFWTEFAARYPNFNFRAAAADVPTYQYINLDVACVFVLMLLSFYLLIRMLLNLYNKNARKKKQQ